MAALGLGLLSALAVVNPLFLVVPLVTLAVAAAAIRDVEREGVRKVGRLAALAAVALAAGFGGQAVAASLAARAIAASRAAAVADLFLTAVRDGRLADAEAMCGPEARQAVAGLAVRVAGRPRLAPVPGDQPGTWAVRIPADPQGSGDVRLLLAPSVAVQQGGAVERWLVTACEPTEEQAVRPSAR
ncbi:MAG: hypothetical protein EBS56_00850 [Planctomycetia bacterium]|nr:hypothetical protein [Planctomycetia bacterium]